MIQLRPYQEQAVLNILHDWDEGHSTLIAMVMGMGKTETFLSALAQERARAKSEGKPFRAMIIAHRKELIDQPVERIARHWSDQLPTPGIVMANNNDAGHELIIATIQTLNVDGRLAEIFKHGDLTHIVIDEAHHAVASTYLRVIERAKQLNPDVRILGVTATPKRTDGAGLRKVFDRVAFRATLKEAIFTYKALSPFRAMGVQLGVDFANVPMVGDDYEAGAVDSLMSADNAIELVFEAWQQHAGDRRTMIFTAGVQQAAATAAYFASRGVRAAFAHGGTPRGERDQIVKDYRAGRHQVLVNCQLWTEGFDAPETSCVVMARPTRSDSLYMQCVGRGLRLAEGKADALILDCVPINGRDLIMAGDLLGKPKAAKKAESKAKAAGVIIDAFEIKGGQGLDADPDDITVTVLDLLTSSKPTLSWTFDGDVATASISEAGTVAIVVPNRERLNKAESMRGTPQWSPKHQALYDFIRVYRVYVHGKQAGTKEVFFSDSWDEAVAFAEDYALTWGDTALLKKSLSWRKQPPSEKQRAFAVRLGVWQDEMTRGACAQAITHALTKRPVTQMYNTIQNSIGR